MNPQVVKLRRVALRVGLLMYIFALMVGVSYLQLLLKELNDDRPWQWIGIVARASQAIAIPAFIAFTAAALRRAATDVQVDSVDEYRERMGQVDSAAV